MAEVQWELMPEAVTGETPYHLNMHQIACLSLGVAVLKIMISNIDFLVPHSHCLLLWNTALCDTDTPQCMLADLLFEPYSVSCQ